MACKYLVYTLLSSHLLLLSFSEALWKKKKKRPSCFVLFKVLRAKKGVKKDSKVENVYYMVKIDPLPSPRSTIIDTYISKEVTPLMNFDILEGPIVLRTRRSGAHRTSTNKQKGIKELNVYCYPSSGASVCSLTVPNYFPVDPDQPSPSCSLLYSGTIDLFDDSPQIIISVSQKKTETTHCGVDLAAMDLKLLETLDDQTQIDEWIKKITQSDSDCFTSFFCLTPFQAPEWKQQWHQITQKLSQLDVSQGLPLDPPAENKSKHPFHLNRWDSSPVPDCFSSITTCLLPINVPLDTNQILDSFPHLSGSNSTLWIAGTEFDQILLFHESCLLGSLKLSFSPARLQKLSTLDEQLLIIAESSRSSSTSMEDENDLIDICVISLNPLQVIKTIQGLSHSPLIADFLDRGYHQLALCNSSSDPPFQMLSSLKEITSFSPERQGPGIPMEDSDENTSRKEINQNLKTMIQFLEARVHTGMNQIASMEHTLLSKQQQLSNALSILERISLKINSNEKMDEVSEGHQRGPLPLLLLNDHRVQLFHASSSSPVDRVFPSTNPQSITSHQATRCPLVISDVQCVIERGSRHSQGPTIHLVMKLCNENGSRSVKCPEIQCKGVCGFEEKNPKSTVMETTEVKPRGDSPEIEPFETRVRILRIDMDQVTVRQITERIGSREGRRNDVAGGEEEMGLKIKVMALWSFGSSSTSRWSNVGVVFVPTREILRSSISLYDVPVYRLFSDSLSCPLSYPPLHLLALFILSSLILSFNN